MTLQYRLGSLGFLSGGSKEVPGNAALWDMALAVQWIRNYIGFFGGNPFKIVIMGQGTGASSALTVALTEIAKGRNSTICTFFEYSEFIFLRKFCRSCCHVRNCSIPLGTR